MLKNPQFFSFPPLAGIVLVPGRPAKALILAACMLTCASSWSADASGEAANPAYTTLHQFKARASELTMRALSLLGIHYQFGGNTPESGLDCSGLVRYVFKEAWGTELPRTAEQISRLGQRVDTHELQPGDLVFYNTLRRTFSHVGIYLGENKFIHSPARGGEVRIENMDVSYWKKRFNGARRIAVPEAADTPADQSSR